ncbi:hypothetical protein RB195_009442 [Necator americanus]|uniref:Uncharacterized protein n=1 Tax=Necator americanus TaxID=51031 RepID=A0ABR1CTX4_NECAM
MTTFMRYFKKVWLMQINNVNVAVAMGINLQVKLIKDCQIDCSYDFNHMVAILLANDTCAVSDRRLRGDASVKEMAGCGNSRGDW